MEAHGGSIRAGSDGPGLGARFTFTIPTVEGAGYVSPAASTPPLAAAGGGAGAGPGGGRRSPGPPACPGRPGAVGHTPIVTADPEEALRLVESERPHLVLLDLALPESGGIELMQEMAARTEAPVIFLSAHGQEHLVARALDLGAADYLVKPFSPVELAARIRAALRRRETPGPSAPYVLGDLAIDYAMRRVSLADQSVPLTDVEYRTLAELAANAGRVLTYEHLLRRVWRLEGDADLRPMRTAISSLRRKLGDDAEDPTYIFTQLRVGYWMPVGEGDE